MTRILTLSDSGVPSGYGRIHDHLMIDLTKRGYQITAASLQYDGLLPPVYEGQALGQYYHVASLAGHPNWPDQFTALVNTIQPDILVVIQDAPYLEAVRNLPLDWSRFGFVGVTPCDGKPVLPQWVETFKKADGMLSISQFGVNAHKEVGVTSLLCRPGIDPNVFFKQPHEQQGATREKLGIAPDAFVVGSVAMNQGRKRWPAMLGAFFEFAKDKPTARFLANTAPQSPAGWDLMQICQQWNWDMSQVIWKHDCERLGVHELRDRYNVMDVHMVIAEREGFGLPLVEAQACGVVSMALDWSSGPEVCGAGFGLLVKTVEQQYPYDGISTWGGALNKVPDIADMVKQLQLMYDHPEQRAAIAVKGMTRARTWTWHGGTDNLVQAIERAADKRRKLPLPTQAPMIGPRPPVAVSPDGLKAETVELMEA
jgi:glycosyltransferase involved in cell wall biosynthesis